MPKCLISLAEILAAITFFPLGVTLGYYFTAFRPFDSYSNELLNEFRFWPFIVSIGCAFVTALAMIIYKLYHNKYKFEHFFIIAQAMIVMTIGGIILIIAPDENPRIGLYFCFAGHGIAYIPTLTYINIRASINSYRNFNVSLAHFFYLFGVAIAGVLSNGQLDQNGYLQKPQFLTLTQHAGIVILCTSLAIILAFIGFEMNRKRSSTFDYKRSLDESVEMEIFSSQIFNQKYFLPTQNLPDANFSFPNVVIKELSMFVFVTLSKATSLIYFFYPIYYYAVVFTGNNSSNFASITQLHWMGVVGLSISILLLFWFSSKTIFLISLIIKLNSIVIVTILFSTNFNSYGLMIFMWFFMCFNAFGYSLPDIFIIDFASLKFNELILAFGYLIEMLTTSMIFYNFVSSTGTTSIMTAVASEGSYSMIHPCIAFSICYGVLAFGLIILIPRTHYKSLLESRNLSWVQYHNMKSFLLCKKLD